MCVFYLSVNYYWVCAASVEACRRNIKFNGSVAGAKVESNLVDARVYMLTHPKEFDVVCIYVYLSTTNI